MTERVGEIRFEITEQIGVIKPYPSGWNRELNLVSWNGTSAKYDIRDWSADHEHMSRGLTFHPSEMRKILSLLSDRDV